MRLEVAGRVEGALLEPLADGVVILYLLPS